MFSRTTKDHVYEDESMITFIQFRIEAFEDFYLANDEDHLDHARNKA